MSNLKKAVTILVIFYFLTMIVIIIKGFSAEFDRADYAVVMGSKVDESGEPSDRLKARLDKAFEIYHKHAVGKIIVSGGIGSEGFNEAVVMGNYLRRKGVVYGDVLIDSLGYNTFATATNARKRLSSNKTVIIVSQYFHLARAKLAFEKAGFEKVGAAYPVYFELRDIYSLLREVPAYFWYYTK